MEKKINKIAIFDLDGTLIDTPLPETGKVEYKKKTGKDWPHKGWWGQADSLDIEVFDMPVITDVVNDYNKMVKEPNTLVVLLTGRLEKLRPQVEKLLASKGLKFHKTLLSTGGSTDTFKLKTLDMLVKEYPDSEIHMWEDRLEHIPIFEEWGKKNSLEGKITGFEITVIPAGRH